MKIDKFFRLPQKSILGFKVLTSLQSTFSAYLLLLSGWLLNPFFGITYKQLLSGSIFNIFLNISLIILILNLIDKRSQLKKTNFILINLILFKLSLLFFFKFSGFRAITQIFLILNFFSNPLLKPSMKDFPKKPFPPIKVIFLNLFIKVFLN